MALNLSLYVTHRAADAPKSQNLILSIYRSYTIKRFCRYAYYIYSRCLANTNKNADAEDQKRGEPLKRTDRRGRGKGERPITTIGRRRRDEMIEGMIVETIREKRGGHPFSTSRRNVNASFLRKLRR
jgi:hypothetical protein